MSATLSCTGRYAKEKEAGGLRGQWAKGEGPSGSTMQMLFDDISDLSFKLFCFFCPANLSPSNCFSSGLSEGVDYFFEGEFLWLERKKNKTSEFLHRLFLSVRRRLTSSTRAEPGEHHIHCGEQMEFKKTVGNWWGDYSLRCSVTVIWEEEVASRIASGWRRQMERLNAKGRVHSLELKKQCRLQENAWLDEEKCSSAQAPHAHGAALLDAHQKCSFNSLTEKNWNVGKWA